MSFSFHHLFLTISVVIVVVVCLNSSTAKYSPDSEEEPLNEQGIRDKPTSTPAPSADSYEDDEANQGTDDEKELPDGFEVLDGVVLDTTNVMIQETNDAGTEYKMYDTETQTDGDVMYKRPKRESGWHFIMFEDPLEASGMGHLVLLQKLLGFSIEPTLVVGKELRLYEIFHVDLSNDFAEDDGELEEAYENEDSEEAGRQDKVDPNDSAELRSTKNRAGEPELDIQEQNIVNQIDDSALNKNNDTTVSTKDDDDKTTERNEPALE